MKLLLIGWDAADWRTIDRLVDQGDMPVMKGLIERCTRGNLTTLHPELSPMLWTSIATGKRPFKHGIHGFAEPDLTEGAPRVSNPGRSTKADGPHSGPSHKSTAAASCRVRCADRFPVAGLRIKVAVTVGPKPGRVSSAPSLAHLTAHD